MFSCGIHPRNVLNLRGTTGIRCIKSSSNGFFSGVKVAVSGRAFMELRGCRLTAFNPAFFEDEISSFCSLP